MGYEFLNWQKGLVTRNTLNVIWKNQGVFVKHYSIPPGGNKVQKAILSFKVKVKVKITRSLSVVSFERASLVEYACQIWSLYLLRFKSYSEDGITDKRMDGRTDRQTNRQTDKQTGQKQYAPDHSIRGNKLEAQGPCTGHRSIIAILYCTWKQIYVD